MKAIIIDWFTGEVISEKPYSEWKHYDKNSHKFYSYYVENVETSIDGKALLIYVNIYE